MRRTLRLLTVLLVALVAGGCRTDAAVRIDVQPDGSGTVKVEVTLDAEAAQRLGDPARLRLDDLRSAGWSIDGPTAIDGGGLRVSGTKPVPSAAALPGVLGEIGPDVFRNAEITVDDGFGKVDYRLRSDVALTGDPSQFGDAALTGVFEGLPLARTPEELAAEGATEPAAFTVSVEGHLPGGETARIGPLSASSGSASTQTLDVRGGTTSLRPFLLIGGGVALLLAGVALLITRLRR